MLRVFILILVFIFSCGGGGSNIAERIMDGGTQVQLQFIASPEYGFFVKEGSSGDGTAWDNAFGDLQDAIEAANNHDTKKKVYVAQGTYKPTGHPNGGNGEHEKHFSLRNGIEVIGGYSGEGVGEFNDVGLYKTILSGDINDTPNDNSDDVYHVFYHPADLGLTSSTKLTGVTITKGNANGTGKLHNSGGGMYNQASSPELTNCEFTNNKAGLYGGGMYNERSSPELTKCEFNNNEAGLYGGGMYNDKSLAKPKLTNCKFIDNEANYGGGMYNQASSPELTNCIFTNNKATKKGGGMRNFRSSPELTSCTFTDNTAGQVGGAVHSDSQSNPIFDTKTTRSFTPIGTNNPDGKTNGNVEG